MQISNASRCPAGVRDSVAMSEVARGFSGVATLPRCRAVPRTRGARQFAVDVATHGIAHRFDVLRNVGLTAFAQARGVGGKGSERRLQPVREIGGAAARAFDLALLGVDQAVHLLDQRLHLRRNVRGEMFAWPERISATPRRNASSGRRPSPT